MSTTAQALIEAGYARSTASDAGKLAVDGEMIAHLNRKFQSMFAMMGRFQSANVLAKTTLTFAGTPATVALPSDIADIRRVELASDGSRAYIIPVEAKDRTNNLAMAAYRQGNSLNTVGRAGDPVNGTVWTLFYHDAPTTLSALSTTLDARFPVRFEMVLILDLAIYFSIKDEGRSATAYQALKSEYAMEWQNFLDLIGASNTAVATVQAQPAAAPR